MPTSVLACGRDYGCSVCGLGLLSAVPNPDTTMIEVLTLHLIYIIHVGKYSLLFISSLSRASYFYIIYCPKVKVEKGG